MTDSRTALRAQVLELTEEVFALIAGPSGGPVEPGHLDELDEDGLRDRIDVLVDLGARLRHPSSGLRTRARKEAGPA
ncbi:hypothetical protein [Brevibacterium litoralis]|uniref:hypothetical protein n=1 Tax=Brevibacterium litoralis TaxID=3138935 RepID=UPI0032F010AE